MSLENKRLSRRTLVRLLAMTSGGLALAACAQPAPAPTAAPAAPAAPAATAAPAAPAVPAAPAAPAAAPTTAPAAPAAPAATAAPAAPAAAPTAAPTVAAPAGTPQKGGILRAAMIGEPPSMDPHFTTANVTSEVTSHICQTLFTLDDKLGDIPLLAESMDTSADGLTRTIKLRKGVIFHNGKEMTTDDVVASLTRWSKMAGTGKMLFDRVTDLGTPDKYTLVFKMKVGFAPFMALLSFRSQAAAIMPKEECEAATEKNQITKPIGTGPYKFVEQQKDRFIRVARHDKFTTTGDAPNGGGGKIGAYFDEIRFMPTPDQSVRVAGVQSGDFDYAEGINPDQFIQLKDSKTVTALVGIPSKCPTHYFNKKSAVTSDPKLRLAMQACIDCEAALKAGWGSPEFYTLSGALMPKEKGPGWQYYTEVAIDKFNNKSVDKAKALLKESNYKGEPIRYLTNKEYPNMYQESVVLNQNFQALGLNMKYEVLDWASVVARRAKPEEWEMFVTWNGYYTDPSLIDWLNPAYPGWWTNAKIDPLRDKLLETIDFKARYAVFEDIQKYFYNEDPPMLKLGDVKDLWLTSTKLKAIGIYPSPYFWHSYLVK